MLSSMVMFIFLFWTEKYPFRPDLVPEIKIVYWRWNLASRLIRICWIWWWCLIFLFWTANFLILGKFDPKSQNCVIKVKLGTHLNSNMLNSMLIFICLFCTGNTFWMVLLIFSVVGWIACWSKKLNLRIFDDGVWRLGNETDVKKVDLNW